MQHRTRFGRQVATLQLPLTPIESSHAKPTMEVELQKFLQIIHKTNLKIEAINRTKFNSRRNRNPDLIALPSRLANQNGPAVRIQENSPLQSSLTSDVHHIMVDDVFDLIISVLDRSGYHLVAGEITSDYLDFQMRAEQKKYSNPEFDPTLHQLDRHNSLWLEIRDKDEETIGTISGRYCKIESFFSICSSYEFWYGDKIRFSEPLNIVYTHYDRVPIGNTVYDGAMWVRPDHRNRGLSWALSRLCRLTALRMWTVDWIFGFGFPAVTKARLPTSVYGYPHHEMFATGFKFPGYPPQSIHLATMTHAEAMLGVVEDWQHLNTRPIPAMGPEFARELRALRAREASEAALAESHCQQSAAIA